jgi:hypothetical protein
MDVLRKNPEVAGKTVVVVVVVVVVVAAERNMSYCYSYCCCYSSFLGECSAAGDDGVVGVVGGIAEKAFHKKPFLLNQSVFYLGDDVRGGRDDHLLHHRVVVGKKRKLVVEVLLSAVTWLPRTRSRYNHTKHSECALDEWFERPERRTALLVHPRCNARTHTHSVPWSSDLSSSS